MFKEGPNVVTRFSLSKTPLLSHAAAARRAQPSGCAAAVGQFPASTLSSLCVKCEETTDNNSHVYHPVLPRVKKKRKRTFSPLAFLLNRNSYFILLPLSPRGISLVSLFGTVLCKTPETVVMSQTSQWSRGSLRSTEAQPLVWHRQPKESLWFALSSALRLPQVAPRASESVEPLPT